MLHAQSLLWLCIIVVWPLPPKLRSNITDSVICGLSCFPPFALLAETHGKSWRVVFLCASYLRSVKHNKKKVKIIKSFSILISFFYQRHQCIYFVSEWVYFVFVNKKFIVFSEIYLQQNCNLTLRNHQPPHTHTYHCVEKNFYTHTQHTHPFIYT